MDNKKIYDVIKSHLQNKIPLAIGKIGANELNFLYTIDNQVSDEIANIYSFNLMTGAGCYLKCSDENVHKNKQTQYLKKFMCEKYLSALKHVDIFACWNHNHEYEKQLIKLNNPLYLGVELKSLEPYYFCSKWSEHLDGKKVLIISPFTESIKKQYKKKDLIWDNVLPTFTPIYLNFPLSYYLQEEVNRNVYPNSSHELLEKYNDMIRKIDFDIALIGVGVYSLPLAVTCKKLGKIGFHLGGGLQVLFGIKGNRWKDYTFTNEYWISPSEDETPKYKDICEDGCYW